MKKKKVIAVIITIAVLTGAAAGGIIGYKAYQGKKLVAEVYPVSNISTGYWGDENYSSGMVTNDSSQEVYLSDTSTVQEVFVEEGDTVEVGDPLIAYDMASVNIQVKQKELDINTIDNNIAIVKHNLEVLKATTPVNKTKPATTVSTPVMEEPVVDAPIEEMELPEVTETGAYNYVTTATIPTNTADAPDGSSTNPYRFLCSSEAYVTGNYLNTLIANKAVAVFEVREGNVASGELVTSWTVNGAYMTTSFEDAGKYYVMTHEKEEDIIEDNGSEEIIMEDNTVEEWVEPEGYTAEELAAAIAEAEAKLKTLDIDKRKAELELETLQKTSEDGTLYATVAGTVKTVGDLEDYVNDGTAFLVVAGSEGLYVTGAVSELLLDQVGVGTVVTASSWESGMSFEAVITEISDYPTESDSYYGEGNYNCSYYPYTAYIEDTTGLKNGEYLDLSITTGGDSGSAIYLEKAYVRTEDGKSYVMVANEDDKLEKRYVTTGKTIYGYAIEITSGLSMEDRVAFPYGKNAVEGVSVTDAEDSYYY
ncbi:MAG: efflux RND transporter periplasmic adaptor subunit [Roseburia sp.]